MLQDCDRSVREICEQCGWKNDLQVLLSRNSTAHAANPKQPFSKKKHDAKASPSSRMKPRSTKQVASSLHSMSSKKKTAKQKYGDHHH